MVYDTIVVGGGIAGLTAASYLAKAKKSVILFEKENKIGGLVSTFKKNNITFDGGIRALESSGIVIPMIEQLKLDITLVSCPVKIILGKDTIELCKETCLLDYAKILTKHFPENKKEIHSIISEIEKIMNYMDILYGIKNPLFIDKPYPLSYLKNTLLPWLIKYLFTMPKIKKFNAPIHDYLKKFTDNTKLIDAIAQHFFTGTPSFFALSYFSLYLDYKYPMGSTSILPDKLAEFILNHGGLIKTKNLITTVDIDNRYVMNEAGEKYYFKELIWASDQKKLYTIMQSTRYNKQILSYKKNITDKRGSNSIFTVYLSLSCDASVYKESASGHVFYTPNLDGLSSLTFPAFNKEACYKKEWLFTVVKSYLERSTFEISCPSLRDETLAPKGKSGIIVSTLMDYNLARYMEDKNWYKEFKTISANTIIEILSKSLFPDLKKYIIDFETSTPLTIERITGNTDGSITGWAFTNSPIPSIHTLPEILKSVKTGIKHLHQAGQWTFSPAGLPIAILTGKLAADNAIDNCK